MAQETKDRRLDGSRGSSGRFARERAPAGPTDLTHEEPFVEPRDTRKMSGAN
jgi:hypothetical protein